MRTRWARGVSGLPLRKLPAYQRLMQLRAARSGPLTGVADIPGDKSCSHRALILGAMANGETRISGLLDSLDVDRAAVVGHDWGAVLAWAYAMARPDRVDRLVAVSVGHPAARGRAGLAQQVKGAYIPVFLVPGLAERLLPAGGWYLLRHAAWGGASPADVPDLARQVEDMSSPGALTAALSWYRANIRLPRPRPRLPGRRRRRVDPRRPARPSSTLACPVMGVWSTGDPALTEAQMTGSARYVTGPWRYERIEGVGHWVPVEAPDELGALLVDFLS